MLTLFAVNTATGIGGEGKHWKLICMSLHYFEKFRFRLITCARVFVKKDFRVFFCPLFCVFVVKVLISQDVFSK